MEDLGNIELTTYEMKVEPKTINVSWSKLPQPEGFKYKPPKRRKAVLEPVTVTFDAYDKNGVKYNMTKTFMLESYHGTFEDDKSYTLEEMKNYVKKRLDEITKVNLYDIGNKSEYFTGIIL